MPVDDGVRALFHTAAEQMFVKSGIVADSFQAVVDHLPNADVDAVRWLKVAVSVPTGLDNRPDAQRAVSKADLLDTFKKLATTAKQFERAIISAQRASEGTEGYDHAAMSQFLIHELNIAKFVASQVHETAKAAQTWFDRGLKRKHAVHAAPQAQFVHILVHAWRCNGGDISQTSGKDFVAYLEAAHAAAYDRDVGSVRKLREHAKLAAQEQSTMTLADYDSYLRAVIVTAVQTRGLPEVNRQ